MRRRVRLGDVRPSGRLRLDSVARYLQDVAIDDVGDAGVADDVAWVVRRTAVDICSWPRYDEVVDVATWCSGVGAAWAERRTTVTCEEAVRIETVSIYVSLDPTTMRPVPPTERFLAAYGPTGGDRKVRSRLVLPGPDDSVPPGRPWPLRSSDIDLFGHVNNAVAWAAIEDEMARVPGRPTVVAAEVEYRRAMEPGCDPVVTTLVAPGSVRVWLSVPAGDGPAVSAYVRTARPPDPPPSPPPP